MVIYMENTLNLMLQSGKEQQVRQILKEGIHRNREKAGNYVIILE